MKRHLFKYRWRYGLGLYALIALMTFGHHAARDDLLIAKTRATHATCVTNHPDDSASACPAVPDVWTSDIVGNAALAGLFWPIYETWMMFDKIEGVPS